MKLSQAKIEQLNIKLTEVKLARTRMMEKFRSGNGKEGDGAKFEKLVVWAIALDRELIRRNNHQSRTVLKD